MELTERIDLRTGNTPWDDGDWDRPESDPLPHERQDVAIVGAGITAAIIAERLTASGRSVVLLDRRAPGMGSTAASTAQIMWAMDVPLCQLAARIGEEEAARRWRRVYDAVRNFGKRLDDLSIAAAKSDCPTLYLEGRAMDAAALRNEAQLHRRHRLPSRFLAADEVERRFGLAGRAAIVSDQGFTIDPVATALELLGLARMRGASICYPSDVLGISEVDGGVRLSLGDGSSVEADHAILATGYERAPVLLPPAFALLSTFVIATPPGSAPLWNERAMIWEAANPYLYFRVDAEGRVIVGGEDIELADPSERDALISEKAGTIAAKAGRIIGTGTPIVDRAWSATFGSSPDGLPAIGLSALMPRVWLAAGFGGNGIAFSALAAEIISATMDGEPDPDADLFNPYRF